MNTTTNTVGTAIEAAYQGNVDAYRSLDVKGKAKVRKALQSAVNTAIDALDLEAATAAKSALQSVVGSTAKAAAPKVDPAEVVARRVATLRHAADLIESGSISPDGLDTENVDYEALPEVTVEWSDETALKIARAKVTRSTERRSIQGVIDRAFEDAEEGDFLTVREITAAGSLTDYRPSDGAVAARLFPKSGDVTVEGVDPVEATADAPRGAVKV